MPRISIKFFIYKSQTNAHVMHKTIQYMRYILKIFILTAGINKM